MNSTRIAAAPRRTLPLAALAAALLTAAGAQAQPAAAVQAQPAAGAPAQPAAGAKPQPAAGARPAATRPAPVAVPQPATQSAPRTPESVGPSEIGPSLSLVVGKSTLIRLPAPIERISVGNPAVADVTLINPRELYLLGKTFGSTNVMMWRRNGPTTIIDVVVNADIGALQHQLRTLLPNENGIKAESAADSLVLTGTVSSLVAAQQAVQIAESFIRTYARGFTMPVVAGNDQVAEGQALRIGTATQSGGAATGAQYRPRVVNLMRVAQPQQVMLEVKVAEVSKNLLDKLGSGLTATGTSGSWRYGIITDLLANGAGAIFGVRGANGDRFTIDAERKDGLVKVLAEPNIVAISGQEASFLAGGKIFIPVARTNPSTGFATITLEEKEFGVGLKFMPIVLEGGRIHLRVAPEVSELAQTGSPFTTVGGVTAVLPTFTTRRAQTTVQLMDGQSLAIAGLIKNNVTESVKRLPVLGEVPILGTLFRSSEFQTDRSELMFVITPRLVKPLGPEYALPTDSFVPPSRSEFFIGGELEGSGSTDVPPDAPRSDMAPGPAATSTTPASGALGSGYQLR